MRSINATREAQREARERKEAGAAWVPVECDGCGRRGVKVPRSSARTTVLCEDCAAHLGAENDDR